MFLLTIISELSMTNANGEILRKEDTPLISFSRIANVLLTRVSGSKMVIEMPVVVNGTDRVAITTFPRIENALPFHTMACWYRKTIMKDIGFDARGATRVGVKALKDKETVEC
jgi:hypothetical protein